MASLRTALFERVEIFLEESSNSVSAYKEIYTVAERAQRAANRKNTCKLRKRLPQFDNTHAANAHNTTKKRNTLQIEKNTCKLRKQLAQFDNTHAANAHNTTKKRNALQIEKTPAN